MRESGHCKYQLAFLFPMQEITIFYTLSNIKIFFRIQVLDWNFWVKAVLEQCFLKSKSELLKEDESKTVACLQLFFNEKLVEQFQDKLPSLKEKSKLYVNFSIAHYILSPLTDEYNYVE